MSGYHNNSTITAFDEDGWLKTGDVVYIDEDFCFFVVDRLSELIKCKGWYVSPIAIEAILKTHFAVDEAVVVGVTHKEDGERPTGFVLLKPGYRITANEIENFVNEGVDKNSKLTGGVKFVESFTLTPTGKINRKQLKDTVVKESLVGGCKKI